MDSHVSIFDDKVPYKVRYHTLCYCSNSTFRLGWSDSDEPDKFAFNMHSSWSVDDLKSTGLLPYFEKCIDHTKWFKNKELDKVILNLVRPDDVHHIHHHTDQQVLLYYVNLDWMDGWHGETIFYNSNNLNEVDFTSLYIPGRIILFDGNIPHAIRPQSIKGPKFRHSLSLFFK